MGSFRVKTSRVVLLTAKQISVANAFATLRTMHGDSYGDTHQTNPEKIRKDILGGALGEIGVWRYLKCSMPDFKYYDKTEKSYKTDLQHLGWNIAVKTQWADMARAFGMSWMFQLETRDRRADPIVEYPKDYITFCLAKDDCSMVAIQAIVNAADVIPRFLEPPKLDKLKSSKACIYWSSIEAAIAQGDLEDHSETLKGAS